MKIDKEDNDPALDEAQEKQIRMYEIEFIRTKLKRAEQGEIRNRTAAEILAKSKKELRRNRKSKYLRN